MTSPLLTVALKLGVNCRCGRVVPVNGITASAQCPDCGHRLTLNWKRVLTCGGPGTVLARANAWRVGRREISATGGIRQIAERKAAPECPECKRAISTEEIEAALGARTPLVCAGCRGLVALRKPPPILQQLDPGARYVLGEKLIRIELAAGRKTARGGACEGCGGPLPIDGTSRSVICDYCDRPNELSEVLWQRLRPPATEETWFIVLGPR